MMEVDRLMRDLDDAKIELEELNESGELEDRLSKALEIEDIERRLFAARCYETGER